MKCENGYYLGLDIGTDSVGYAVTDPGYSLLKFKGEPMWGTTLFEAGSDAAERRAHRVNRRRLDRRQQRVALLQELFAREICATDPDFFIRRQKSALYGEDYLYEVRIFQGGGLTDKQYHADYPTIHHLILELMESDAPHDPRLVYMACAWLVANRGHFLFDIPADRIEELLDFGKVYGALREYLAEQGTDLPWSKDTDPAAVLNILQMQTGVKKKEESFRTKILGGKKPSDKQGEEDLFKPSALVSLLCGRKVKPADLFGTESEVESVSLTMNDEDFARIVCELGEEGELLDHLRKLVDCAKLLSFMPRNEGAVGDRYAISAGKVKTYRDHKEDLKLLKRLVKTYCPKKYNAIFRRVEADNYVAYSRNVKSCDEAQRASVKFVNKEAFSEYLKKQLKGLSVKPADKAAYEDMMTRLDARTFLPKQRDGDNRVIPQQLYRYELTKLLDRAQGYLPLLSEADADGITVREKILAVFDFKIPYYVGPLKSGGGENTWLVRKQEGRILPWNFEDMVDLDASEQEFIRRMTNSCTYYPGGEVLPERSLLYSKFVVLNELNNLKVNDRKISPELKQEIYREVFMKHPKVTVSKIREHLLRCGHITRNDTLTGLDITVKADLRSYHAFRRMLEKGLLTEQEVERIIRQRAYTEDRPRFRRWLLQEFPQLPEEDVSYILRLDLKGFGRLSAEFLTGLYGTEKGSDGEASTVIEAMWETNENLMQLLSDRYTYSDLLKDLCREYYASHPRTLGDRLSEMYISNAVKRPILRALDIVGDVVKAAGKAPDKIFIEMARGGTPDQKGKRTESRKDTLIRLYKAVKSEDARALERELAAMGDMAENRLQSERLFLYYLQLGRCAYTGRPIELSLLAGSTYNVDHIWPQCHVKDDSLLNNKVLVLSEANGIKGGSYPVPAEYREHMAPFWHLLKENDLMTEEKYRRLVRSHPFTADEKQGFINRQLVETRQSTKALATLLGERFPQTEIVYVKAGMVSEFRQEFGLLKCRSVNDLHHAKDAYLNVVVGNVYHERFTRRWFSLDSDYNVQVKKIFQRPWANNGQTYWRGGEDIALVKKTVAKNAVHLTRYAFCRKGGLFDQQPVKKAEGLVPLKAGLPAERYGGYRKPTASFFVLARFTVKNKRELMIVPIRLMDAERFRADPERALRCTADTIREITGKDPAELELMLKGRPLKVNTVFSLDGTLVTLAGKGNGGQIALLSPLVALKLGASWEGYIKALESFQRKHGEKPSLKLDEEHDHISRAKNDELYSVLAAKMGQWPFSNLPSNQSEVMKKGKDKFSKLDTEKQVVILLNMIDLFGSGSAGVDLSEIGGTKTAGTTRLSTNLSNWKKNYTDVRIVDMSTSGLFEDRSENLLSYL